MAARLADVRRVVAILLAVGATASTAQPPAERDWSATLRQDAQGLHDEISANHPGPVNPADPGFARRNDAQLKLALRRAATARTYADYFQALREYAASFDDGHLTFGAFGDTPNDLRWPGFLTDYDPHGVPRVSVREADVPVPLDARLLACDGQSAERFAAETLGRSWGRWQLEAQRLTFGRFLFTHNGDRYLSRPRRCTFESAGGARSFNLAWRPIGFRELDAKLFGSVPPPPSRTFDARQLADGTRWYALPSFNGDPQSAAAQALPKLIATMRADRAALAAAPAVVLDLRRNDGGSSDWSRQIAEVLWGRAAIDRLPPDDVRVYWRASPANLASLEEAHAKRGATASPAVRRYIEAAIAGLRGAIARGEPLWQHVEQDDPAPAAPAEPQLAALAGPVYIVTDPGCMSACLDAVDLWRALGAIQVGRTTGADTLYMEVRSYRLPSGITGGVMPRKVFVGRPRGNNEPARPQFAFAGDIADTPALERWIATLEPR